jgi:nucleoside-diphosphate-sugar epimerase
MLMSKDAIGNIFNIGNPKTAINILDLAKKIIKITCSDSKITFCKHIGTDCRCRIPNIEKAKQILNFKPKVGLDKGLQLSVNWYREHLNHFKDYE